MQQLFKNLGNCAVNVGNFDKIKHLHDNGHHECLSTYIMDRAAANGDLEMVKWLHTRSKGCTTDAMNLASSHGHLEVVKWLHLNRTEGCTADAMDYAAMNGHLEIVRWLHYNRSEGCTPDAMNLAMTRGHYHIVRWLYYNRAEVDIQYSINSAIEWYQWIDKEKGVGTDTDILLKVLGKLQDIIPLEKIKDLIKKSTNRTK